MVDLLRCSAAPQWVECYASATLTTDIPNVSGEAARYGTAIHQLAYLKKQNQPVADFLVVDGVEVFLDELAHDMADLYLRVIELAEMDVDTSGMEAPVDLAWYYDPRPMPVRVAGSADWWGFNFETLDLQVKDLKTGVHPVSPLSPQLKLYALCALGELDGALPNTITLTIVQPRDELNPVKTAVITLEELMAFAQKVDRAVKAIAAGDTTETPGETQCKWCLRAGSCRARYDRSVAIASASFDDGVPVPTGFADDELGAILDRAEEVEAWIKAVRGEVSRRLDLGAEIPGWKLAQKRAMRRWADKEAAEKFLYESGLDVTDIYEPAEVRSPAQAEKVLKKYGFDPKVIEPLVTRESSGTTLVREGDPRPKVSSGVGSQFTSLD